MIKPHPHSANHKLPLYCFWLTHHSSTPHIPYPLFQPTSSKKLLQITSNTYTHTHTKKTLLLQPFLLLAIPNYNGHQLSPLLHPPPFPSQTPPPFLQQLPASWWRDSSSTHSSCRGSSPEARLRVLLRGAVHISNRPRNHWHPLERAQWRQIRVQCAEEYTGEGQWGLHEVLHQGGVDEEARHWGGAVQLQVFPFWVHLGAQRGHPRGPLASHKRTQRDTVTQ